MLGFPDALPDMLSTPATVIKQDMIHSMSQGSEERCPGAKTTPVPWFDVISLRRKRLHGTFDDVELTFSFLAAAVRWISIMEILEFG